MGFSTEEMADLSRRIGRHPKTLYDWAREGCNLRDHASVQLWIEKKRRREPEMVRQYREKKRREAGGIVPDPAESLEGSRTDGNGDGLSPIGRRGAAAALERLEAQEERAHARLEAALA